MASTPDFLEYVRDQLRGAGAIGHRRMFGEYALYLDDKVVALVCDDQLYVKPTDAGRTLLGTPREAPPYPGAKPYFLMAGELDDPELMAQLMRATAAALPVPKPRGGASKRRMPARQRDDRTPRPKGRNPR